MKLDRFIRVAIAVVVLLVFVIAIGALLFISESALNVWDRLNEGPRALLYAYVGVMLFLAVAAVGIQGLPGTDVRIPMLLVNRGQVFVPGQRAGNGVQHDASSLAALEVAADDRREDAR